MRRALALTAAAALIVLAGCNPNEDGPGLDKPVTSPPPPGVHTALSIEAAKDTHYRMLCDVRTYQSGPGQIANRYGVDHSGPFTDTIMSPNAHCTIELVSGPQVKVTLSKPGSTQTATVTTTGDAGKTLLHMW
jgi:hypothetical protein